MPVQGPNARRLLRDLQGSWPIDEVSGTRRDVSGNGLTLTDNNTVTQANGPSAKMPKAGQFTRATNESLSLADNAPLSAGNIDITYDCRFYMDSKPVNYPNIMGKRNTNQNEISIFYANGAAEDRIKVGYFGDGLDASETDLEASSLGSPSLATWYHIVTWHDAVNDTINVQVNNSAVDSAAYTSGLTDTTGTFRFGGSHIGAAQAWDGRIAGGNVWKRILSDIERAYQYNRSKGRRVVPGRGVI